MRPARFKNKDSFIGILGKPRRYREAGRTTANDDIVEMFVRHILNPSEVYHAVAFVALLAIRGVGGEPRSGRVLVVGGE